MNETLHKKLGQFKCANDELLISRRLPEMTSKLPDLRHWSDERCGCLNFFDGLARADLHKLH